MLLRTPAAAQYLDVSTGYLEKLRHVGNGPPYAKLSRAVVYRSEDLDAWVKSKLVQTTGLGRAS